MAFVTVNLAESIAITTETATDSSNSTEANLNDANTATTATTEIRQGMAGYKITHDLGFAVGNLSSLSIRVFDGVVMTTGNIKVYPYSAGDTDVVTGNEGTLAILDNGAYDTLAMSAGFLTDLGDVGTNQISIRFAPEDIGSLRGRFNEIEIEFAQIGGPTRRVMVVS